LGDEYEVVEELQRLGVDSPAVARNAERTLASLKMLEINVSDMLDDVPVPSRDDKR
jgi:hypothetical protein